MKQKILLVDDENDIIEFLKYNLELEDFEVITGNNGERALELMHHKPDLIILDVMMPKLNGFEVLKKIRSDREYANIPVIFLTAKSSELDEIEGLMIGADDYIKKPVSPKKLIARVKSNLRKTDLKNSIDKSVKYGPVEINKDSYKIYVEGSEIIMPKKEFEILAYLISSPGKVFPREKILKDVWGSDIYVVERTIDVHVRKIREKLGDNSDLIETIKGVGYRFKSIK